MNRIAIATAVLAMLPAARAFADAGTFDRTLATSSTPAISVQDGAGKVVVHPGADRQLHVIGHLRPSHDGDRDALARIAKIVAAPPIVQQGDTVKIGVEQDPLYRDIVIDYDVAVPVGSALSAATGSGDVTIDNCGASVVAHAGSGNVIAHGVSGPANLGTGSGTIDLVHAGAGDIVAATGSGDIRVVGAAAALDAHSGSGGIHAAGAMSAPWTVKTGSGDVDLQISRAARFTLDAGTGSGDVRIDHAMTDQRNSRHHVSGAVNGGGAQLQISTGSGDIRIKAV